MANNGVFDLPRQATGSIEDAAADRLELGASEGTGKLFSVDENGVVTEYGLGTVPQENIYYVGKHGSDSNIGTTVGQAVLTIGQAITLAEGQTPGPSNGFVIYIVDGGIYTENIHVSPYLMVYGPGAVILGNTTIAGNAGLTCLLVLATTGVAFTKTTDSGTALLRASYCRASGTADALECDNGELICDIATLNTENGDAIVNSGSGCHIHGTISKITVSGTGKAIVSTGASTEMSLYISEITGASATGIDIDDGEVYLHLGEFSVGTGGDVASGAELKAFIADLYGNTFTGTGDIDVTEAGVTPAHAPTHESGGADAIKLDNLAAPDDNTDLNVSLSAHGLMVKLPGGTKTFFRADGSYAETPVGALTGSSWDFDDSTSDADPGSGNFRLNSGTQSSATFLYVSDTSKSGVNYSSALLGLKNGDKIYLQEQHDTTRYHLCSVSGDVTDATTYVKIPITVSDSGSDLQDTEITGFIVITGHAAAAPPTVIQGSEDAEDSSTDTSYALAYRFSPTLEASTKYILLYDSEVSAGSSTSWSRSRLQIDDSVTVTEVAHEVEAIANDEWWKMSGVYFLTTTSAGTYDFDFDIQTEDNTVYIRRKRIVLMKVVE